MKEMKVNASVDFLNALNFECAPCPQSQVLHTTEDADYLDPRKLLNK